MGQERLYPIGIQTFEKIRRENYVYIDKTEYVYRITHSGSNYKFLSRPRRFGKSLLTSTLHAYFEGRKELFEGLAISRLETEWMDYPVLHFDMSLGKHLDKDALERYLIQQIEDYEEIYGIKSESIDANIRLVGLIKSIHAQTGRRVVVLVDEYDAPLLDVVHEERNLPVMRNVMRNFYSPLKACDPYLRFVFLTGITKFSQLSIFSELNNIENISMDGPYAAVCGITEEEILTQMSQDVDLLAKRMKVTREEALTRLKDNYDGYHFTWPSSDVYNPFSLLTAMSKGRIDSYWFGSGTPTYLVEMLRKFGVLPSELVSMQAMATDFDAPTEYMESIVPLLYQSGYVTIKDYSPLGGLYTLGIPNKEVRIGLMDCLLPNYLSPRTQKGRTTVGLMAIAIQEGRFEDSLRLLQAFLLTVPYCDNTDSEGHYQQMLYIIFSLLGMFVDVEVRTATGRVDLVMRTSDTLYVIELKLNRSASSALAQIDLKRYPERFALCGLPVVKVGIGFDSEQHTLSGWTIEKA